MTSGTRRASALLLVGTASALAMFGCGAEDFTRPPAGTVFVGIRDTFFTPESVTVLLGKSVRWTNEGALQHTVVADSVPWQSSLLAPTFWFEVLFDSAGAFTYHCSQHPGMTGTVVVQ